MIRSNRTFLLALVAASSIFILGLAGSALAEDRPCDIADSSIAAASEIRKLRIKKAVPCFVQDKESVRTHIMDLVKEKTPPQKMKLEGLAYKTLGFIPESFDYEQGLIDLYVSQLGGYYDPGNKFFVMAGWMPAMFQTTIAVHELTHALQDQYFDLEKFIDPKIESSDLLLARSALVEGDATAVMLDYARKLNGMNGIAADANVESTMLQNVIGSAMSGGMAGVPQSLQLTLIFPYTSGLRFAHRLLRMNGYLSIDEAFKSPPRSTEEVLHVDKYFEKKPDFKTYTDSEVLRGRSGTIVYRDTMGEFAISALLGMYDQQKIGSVDAAAGWGGDRLVVLGQPDDRYTYLWATNWDTGTDADEFYRAYSKVLEKRYPEQLGKSVLISRSGNEVFVTIDR